MADIFRIYDSLHGLLLGTLADAGQLWKLALLVAVAIIVGWRLVFAWLGGSLSGPEALVLTIALLAAEAAAVRWLRDFDGVRFALLLALPAAVWISLSVLLRVTSSESYYSTVQADIQRFRAAIRRDPTNVAARVFLGDAYLKLNRLPAARATYNAALALDPNSYETRYKLERLARLASPRSPDRSRAPLPG